MTETLTIQAKTRKPIAWWKAGLLGALVSLGCLSAYLIVDDIFDIDSKYIIDPSDDILFVILVVPTLVYIAIYTALGKNQPKNLVSTIKVALMSITIPAIFAYYVVYLVMWLFFKIFTDEATTWGIKELTFALAFFGTIYGGTAIVAIILWFLFGRGGKQLHSKQTNPS